MADQFWNPGFEFVQTCILKNKLILRCADGGVGGQFLNRLQKQSDPFDSLSFPLDATDNVLRR